MAERRQHKRIPGPFDGTWSGTSGGHPCRVTDLSAGGCYVNSLGAQVPGTPVTVTITTALGTLTLPATVIMVDTGMGFSVEFTNVSSGDRKTLETWVEALGPR